MSFVVTAGQIERVHRVPAYSPLISSHVRMATGEYYTYEALWKSQPALRSVIGFIARNVAQLGIHVFERVGDNDRQRRREHPLAKLLARPFPSTAWTTYRLVNWTLHELCIYDDAYWLKGKVGPDLALMPIPRRFVRPIGKNLLFPDRYELTGSGEPREVDADEIVHFHGYNPIDPRIGTPPIETLRQVLAEEWSASQYREQLWKNGARVGGFITRPKDAPRWSEGAKDRFKRDWRDQYGGSGHDAGGVPLLEDGMLFQPSAVTPKDAQYVEARKLTREEVAVAYFVPPSMLGIMDGPAAASIPEIHRMFYQDALAPWLTQIGQDIENQLLPDLDPAGAFSSRVYVEFNIQEKLRGSFEAQAAALQSSVGGPWMTRSEARSRFNLTHLDEADELIVPMNVTEGGLASPRDTAPDNPSNAESNGLLPGPKPAA